MAVVGTAEKIAALNPLLDQTCLRHTIAYEGSNAKGALDFHDLLASARSDFQAPVIEPSQESTVAYTSGTTGHPKGAVLSHRAILMNTAMTATMHVRTASDTVISALPLSHVYGNIVMNAAMAYGMTLVLHRAFDAERVLQSVQDHSATLLEGVPTMYMYMLNSPRLREFNLSSLTRCTVGGQTMPEAKMRQVEEAFGCPLIELWGMTELGGLGTTHSLYGPRRLGSIGVALPHLEVRIVAPDAPHRVMAAGETGELQIRGAMTIRKPL